MTIAKLHFVYNVELSAQALVRDFVHRLVDPETYPCKLCDLTYGRFVKKPGWQLFVWSLPVASVFHTKDAFAKAFPSARVEEFPVVLAEDKAGRFAVFISADELAATRSLEALKTEVSSRLEKSTLPSAPTVRSAAPAHRTARSSRKR